MIDFRDLVATRADRLLDAPFEMLPDAQLFAVDTELKPPDDWLPIEALPTELAERLRLTKVLDELETASTNPSAAATPAVPGERRPIVDLPRRLARYGWPEGWTTEFAYVDFHGERWEERNIKTLYIRVFKWLWENQREELLQWAGEHEGLIAGPGGVGHWERLDDEHYLQKGQKASISLGTSKRHSRHRDWPAESMSCMPMQTDSARRLRRRSCRKFYVDTTAPSSASARGSKGMRLHSQRTELRYSSARSHAGLGEPLHSTVVAWVGCQPLANGACR